MSPKTVLKSIVVIAFGGMIFSGYLSYREIFLGSCQLSFVRCGTATGPILGVPACVYGLVMYSIIFLLAVSGLISQKKIK